MELFNSLKLYIIVFITCDMLIECLCQLPGICWGKYRSEIVKNNHQDNVLYVCTNSQLSNATNTVYMDLAKVPRFENSTCYCTMTSTNEKEGDFKSVILAYTIESYSDALTVNGYGADRFSIANASYLVQIKRKVNNITFKLTSPETDFKSCLRITNFYSNGLFRVECYSNQITPESTKSKIENGHGAVIGGAVGGGVFLVIVTVIAVFVLKRRETKTDQRKHDDHYINEIGLNNVGNVTTDSANEGTYETPVANSVDENKYETLTTITVDGTSYETLTTNSADGTNYETPLANSVDENKYETLTANSADRTNYKTPVAESADEYKYENIAAPSTEESKYENVTENDNFSAKSTNSKAYVNEDVIQSIKK